MITFLTILALFGFLVYTPAIGGTVFSTGRVSNYQILIWAFFLTAFIALKWLI